MKHLTILVFGGWMISDLCRDRRNRQTLLFALVITGLAFSLVGIFQKAAGSRSLLFSEKEYPGDVMTFFASYRYHGNAATLLNYCWPLAAALLLADFLKKEKYWRIAVLACATLFTLSALFINTSKFGHATTPFLLLVFVVLYFRPLKKVTRGVPHRRVMLVVAGTVLVALMMALAAISFSDSVEKWGGAEARNNMLNRDYESDSKLYESLLDKLKVANVEREYKPSEIAVLEPPVLPPGPRYVNKASYYLKYGAVSLGLGLGLALFLGSMDTRIRRVEDLERLANTQVLTAVPKSSKLAKGMADKTNSAEYEAFRTLHTNNILAVPESKVILVTSSTPKEG